MQIHYNNPGLVAGVIDNSGVTVFYTTTLRQYDADVLELADPTITNPNQIPAGTVKYFLIYNITAFRHLLIMNTVVLLTAHPLSLKP
jgi:energy-converting hydrogenase Eha subunit H